MTVPSLGYFKSAQLSQILVLLEFIFSCLVVAHGLSFAIDFYSKLTELKRIIYATERIQATLRCDDERAIKAVRRAPIQDIEGLTGRLAQTGSSQSQGFVEKWYQTLVSQVRALR